MGVCAPLNVATGSEVRKLVGHTGSVLPVAFSLDGHRIASGSNDGYVIIWDAVLGVTIFRLRRKQGVEHVAFSADCITYKSRDETMWHLAVDCQTFNWAPYHELDS